jgi:hypothetical protein
VGVVPRGALVLVAVSEPLPPPPQALSTINSMPHISARMQCRAKPAVLNMECTLNLSVNMDVFGLCESPQPSPRRHL